MMSQEYLKPIECFPDYGLKQGDRIKVLKGSGCISAEPDWIEVIEETPMFILCKYVYKHWMGYLTGYRHCLNKVHILSGDISFQKEGA